MMGKVCVHDEDEVPAAELESENIGRSQSKFASPRFQDLFNISHGIIPLCRRRIGSASLSPLLESRQDCYRPPLQFQH